MKQFKETIYAHRESEDNWDIRDKAEELGFGKEAISNFKYIGSEIEFKVVIREDGSTKVLKVNEIDVSEKDIFI